tara:strand:+ start:1041 stop:1193 length:153 start_codon:yes stop_codon:yes gene_type:complete
MIWLLMLTLAAVAGSFGWVLRGLWEEYRGETLYEQLLKELTEEIKDKKEQ